LQLNLCKKKEIATFLQPFDILNINKPFKYNKNGAHSAPSGGFGYVLST